ncbi:hypothetical protein ACSBR1_027123 [Camellia fascicularis]
MGKDMHKFRRSRLDKHEFPMNGGPEMVNLGSRQIYFAFLADSTFREEDVSNYSSIYGPVQDVRIPYQQKRMFGFVTFVYPETVKLILAKGNPHFEIARSCSINSNKWRDESSQHVVALLA